MWLGGKKYTVDEALVMYLEKAEAERDRYKAALKQIVAMQPHRPRFEEYEESGNFVDLEVAEGRWEASQVASYALEQDQE